MILNQSPFFSSLLEMGFEEILGLSTVGFPLMGGDSPGGELELEMKSVWEGRAMVELVGLRKCSRSRPVWTGKPLEVRRRSSQVEPDLLGGIEQSILFLFIFLSFTCRWR